MSEEQFADRTEEEFAALLKKLRSELLAERQSKVAQLESELERIDREWHMAREKIQGNLPPLRPTTAALMPPVKAKSAPSRARGSPGR